MAGHDPVTAEDIYPPRETGKTMNWKKIHNRKKEAITDPVGWEFPNGAQGQIGTGYGANKGGPCFIVIYEGPYRDQRSTSGSRTSQQNSGSRTRTAWNHKAVGTLPPRRSN